MADPTTRPLVATYRIQLTPAFGFDEVVGRLETLRHLGISHLYLSPIAEAVAGSQHGYDVVDHPRVRSEFGGAAGLTRLLDAATDHDLGVIVDHVPNHVSVARAELNPRWWELLRDGPDSPAADWFDVDWELTGGEVIVPKLGEPLDDVVAAGAVEVGTGDLGPELRVGTLRFPLRPGTEHLDPADAVRAQHYRLQWWRDPARNVRRFFTIDDLVAVRVEHPHVAHVVDTLPRTLCDHPAFAGVRVDHVDGLADPQRYLDGLRETIGERWLVVEKILGPGEYLPESWPVDGTTGYEHVTVVEHALLDPASEAPLDELWRELVAASGRLDSADFAAIEHASRLEVLDDGLRPDLERLVRAITSAGTIEPVDARDAVVALTLELDRYRTYLPGDGPSLAVLEAAVDSATAANVQLAGALEVVVGLVRHDDDVRTRWQQLTGPVMAKGAEDRAFYRHQRWSSLCEVGGRPGTWSTAPAAFHDHHARVQARWPTNMLTATTHDTKRSEAVRSRSLALAALADEWVRTARTWMSDHHALSSGLRPADVSLALQTAVTAAPLTIDRLHDYLVKSCREADLDTNWFEPDDTYEAGLRALATALVAESAESGSTLGRFIERVEAPGASIGLRLLALQLTCPGVPDLYQGAPMELRSLVDPDNRRPPDWRRWLDLVERAGDVGADDRIDGLDPDLARTVLARRLLGFRRHRPDGFGPAAGYAPLDVSGLDADPVLAFARTAPDGTPVALVVVVRTGGSVGADVAVDLPAGDWRDLVGGEAVGAGSTPVVTLVGAPGVAVLAPAT